MMTGPYDTANPKARPAERLHKVLAHAGVASRRKCEELIASGRVRVNGEIVSAPGSQVDPLHDRIEVDGKPVTMPLQHTYRLLHKPAGYLSTVRDPHGRPTILELVDMEERLYPVGRLDMDSEGLLLLTDDGELTQRLTHPSYEHEKEYHVWVQGRPTARSLQRLREGIELEDGFTWPAEVSVLRQEGSSTWLRFVIHEGRKRQLRRMCEAVGHPVRRLIRVRMDLLTLGDLAPGQSRPLTEEEQTLLLQSAGLAPTAAGGRGRSAEDTPLPGASELNPLATQGGMDSEKVLTYPQAIAIDGPAAAGKSTVGELLARELGYLYFDTGIMYRAVTWAALQRGIPIEDEVAIDALAEGVRIDVVQPTANDGRQYTVRVDGEDVTWELRSAEVEKWVSPVSAYPRVRTALTAQQRRIGQAGKVVMVGRDIGTVVLPEAPLKIYLEATVEERAKRRCQESLARGAACRYEDVLRNMRRRDKIDSEREAAPLRTAEDACVINTTNLTVDQVMERVRTLIRERAQ
jgi:cytidylate kinase